MTTPLHVAAQKGGLAVVKRLVEGGARVGAKTLAVPKMLNSSSDASPDVPPQVSPAIPSLTPIELAQHAKRPEVVAYLKAAR